MFDYINRGLKYSKPAASRRLKAARCVRDNPKALDMLKSAELSLSTICQASSVVKQGNASIERFAGVSAREAEKIASEYKPAPKKKIKDSIKPLGRKIDTKSLALLDPSSDVGTELAPAKHIVRFEVSNDFTEKLEEIRTVISNKIPAGASLEEVLSFCMETCLDKHCPKRKEVRSVKRQTAKRKAGKSKTVTISNSRYIPASIKSTVLKRDGYQCSYISPDGIRCGCRQYLELDHVVPFALGGTNEVDNLRVLCSPHNKMMAREVFGEEFIQSRASRAA